MGSPTAPPADTRDAEIPLLKPFNDDVCHATQYWLPSHAAVASSPLGRAMGVGSSAVPFAATRAAPPPQAVSQSTPFDATARGPVLMLLVATWMACAPASMTVPAAVTRAAV